MSVSTTTKSDWIDGNNDVIVSATPVRVRAVEVQGRTDGTADAWVRLYNSANATPGTTEPTLVVYIPRSQTKDGKVRQKVIFGGLIEKGGVASLFCSSLLARPTGMRLSQSRSQPGVSSLKRILRT